MADHNSAREPSPDAGEGTPESAPVKPGEWVVTRHWRGPVVRAESVGAKQLRLVGGGVLPIGSVDGVFAGRPEAEAAWQRHRDVLRTGESALKPLQDARQSASEALYAAERALKARALAAITDGAGAASTTDASRDPGMGQ